MMIRLSSLRPRFDRLDDPETLLDTLPEGAYFRYPLREEKRWWIHHGDLVIAGDLDADMLLVVTGNLVVHGTYDDYVSGLGHLLVQGSFAADHAHTWGALHVRGDAVVEGVFYADYNDHALHVEGLTSARCFMSLDHSCDVRLTDGVPYLDWNEGVKAHDLKAIFSDEAYARFAQSDDFVIDDSEWVSLPEWETIADLIRGGVNLWREHPTA